MSRKKNRCYDCKNFDPADSVCLAGPVRCRVYDPLRKWSCRYFSGHATLKLVLKERWYRMIEAGEKKEEYRAIIQYWRRRLETGYNEPYLKWRKYDSVTFYLGYAKNRPSMTFEFLGARYGQGRPEWGAKPGEEYYVIKLGRRIA